MRKRLKKERSFSEGGVAMLEILKMEIHIIYSNNPEECVGERTKTEALDWVIKELRRRVVLEVPENTRCASLMAYKVERVELTEEKKDEISGTC